VRRLVVIFVPSLILCRWSWSGYRKDICSSCYNNSEKFTFVNLALTWHGELSKLKLTSEKNSLLKQKQKLVVATPINEVNRHRARLVLGLVTVYGRVNHLGM